MPPPHSIHIHGLDLSIIVLYLLMIIGFGCWAGFRQRRNAQGSGYFLAGRTLTWPMIGLALYSTNISTVHIVSLAQEDTERAGLRQLRMDGGLHLDSAGTFLCAVLHSFASSDAARFSGKAL